MGHIRKTPATLGAQEPTRDDVCDAPTGSKGSRSPRGTRSITPGGVHVNPQKA